MTSRHWSTRAVPAREQFSFWREAVCEAVLNVVTEHPGDGFNGEITCSNFGDLRFAAFASTPHEVVRLKSHISRSSNAHYLVSLQRGGLSRMVQGDATCELYPGDIGIVDGTRPFRVEFLEQVDRVVAVIPHALMQSRAPWLEHRPLNRMPVGSALNGALRFYLERLSGPECGSDAEAAILTDNLCNIIALMTASTGPERASAQSRAILPGLDLMLTTMRQHLADPALSPKMLADRLRVSVRTVHKRFEEADLTFGQWVLDNRLLACRRALDDPRQEAFSVSQIAFGWGFNDLSHFSKAFKARFGVSPARYRQRRSGGRDYRSD